MKIYIKTFFVAAVSAACANSILAADVAAPGRRAEVTELARQLVVIKAPETPSVIYNPFTLSGARTGAAVVTADPALASVFSSPGNDRELIDKLASKIEPSGTVVMGGEAILLLGQNRLKVGDRHSINFEGATYEVEIIAIESTRFSIRYKNEELTRPIVITKSGL